MPDVIIARFPNLPPTPKQKELFKRLVGGDYDYPAWAIPTRQGASMTIQGMLEASNKKLDIMSLVLIAECFAERFYPNGTVSQPTKVTKLQHGATVMSIVGASNEIRVPREKSSLSERAIEDDILIIRRTNLI